MNWKIEENKIPKNKQEIEVKQLLKEMAEYSYATYAEQFANHFKKLLEEIPKSNNFSADLLYKAKPISSKKVEIWKLTISGEYKTKMFTLEYLVK